MTMETMTLYNEVLDARGNSAYLTGIMMGMSKYNSDIPTRTKLFMLEQLIEVHTKHPISNSSRIIDEANELIKTLDV